LKGAFREHLEQRASSSNERIAIQLIFGYDGDGVEKDSAVEKFFNSPESNDYSGALALTDARMLLFPVKSYKGVFSYVTCPMVLKKLRKELQYICGFSKESIFKNFEIDEDKVATSHNDFLTIENKVILEEYAFDVDTSKTEEVKTIAKGLATLLDETNQEIQNRLVILPDDVFTDFVKMTTEVITRTKIQNDTGTVQQGALFTEEYLPAESYMYTIVATSHIFQTQDVKKSRASFFSSVPLKDHTEVLAYFKKNLGDIAQIGGSSTLGKGIVKLFKNQL
jgi:CRISPR-associated protein Cmr4